MKQRSRRGNLIFDDEIREMKLLTAVYCELISDYTNVRNAFKCIAKIKPFGNGKKETVDDIRVNRWHQINCRKYNLSILKRMEINCAIC